MVQSYCVAPLCRRASKAASQTRWLQRPENRDYFRGSENVQRVQAWRAANPGYAKRAKSRSEPLQEMMNPQPAPEQAPAAWDEQDPLQETWRMQPPLLVELIAHLAGLALQEDMAAVMRGLITRGQALLLEPNAKYHDRKTSPLSGTRAPGAGAL